MVLTKIEVIEMAVIVVFGFLMACNIMGVTWLSESIDMPKKGSVTIQVVNKEEAWKRNDKT